jgi:hypothetical protein
MSINETGIPGPFRRQENSRRRNITESVTSIFNFDKIIGQIYPAVAAPGGE